MKFLFAFILAFFLVLALDRAISPSTLDLLGQSTLTTGIVLWLFLASTLIVAVLLMWRQSRTRPWSHHEKFGALILAALPVFLLCFAIVYQPDAGISSVAVLLAAAFATAGWIFTSYISVDNSIRQTTQNEKLHQRQHTLNILLQFRSNPLLQQHQDAINTQYPPNSAVTCRRQIDILFADYYDSEKYGNDKRPVLRSIIYVCNYFEFVSAGVLARDLDEELLRTTLRGIMNTNLRKFGPVINNMITGDMARDPNPKAYENFITLMRNWGVDTAALLDAGCDDSQCNACPLTQTAKTAE